MQQAAPNISLHEGAPAVAEPEPEDFNALVADILQNPERLLKEGDLTPEQVLEFQRRTNPYARIAGEPPRTDRDYKKVVVCSYTNMREDYLTRFVTTGLVGFIFQMLHEWEVPADARRWIPKAKAPDAAPWDPAALAKQLEAGLELARLAADAAAEAAAAKTAAAEADVCAETPEQKAAAAEAAAAADSTAAKAAGLLYAATHFTHSLGEKSTARLHPTAQAGLKYPSVREVLSRYPLPPPASQVEMPPALAKDIIGGFLRHWFRFDPSIHVRSGHNAAQIEKAVAAAQIGEGAPVLVDTLDPGHLTLEAVLAAAPKPEAEHQEAVRYILGNQRRYDAVAQLLRDDDLVEAALVAVESADAFRHYLFPVAAGDPARPAAENIPPQDTFHRANYFREVNFEKIRTITEAIYPERTDFEMCFAPWAVLEGTEKEVKEAFDRFCQKHEKELMSSIKSIEFGAWGLIADFAENRKRIEFYNRNTEVLKRIIDRHAEDKRIGAELMRNRVKTLKAQNIAQEGPDAPGLSAYKRDAASRGQDLNAKGVERVISAEEMRRLEKARGDLKAAKELEHLDALLKTVEDLEGMEARGATLNPEEREQLRRAREDIPRAREMLEVPDDGVQVDVFSSDPTTGEFKKSSFFTRSEEADAAEAEKRAGVPTFAPFAADLLGGAGPQASGSAGQKRG